MELNKKKVLILHPFLHANGGAEYMLSVLANQIFPEADIFTFSYTPAILQELNIDQKRIISPFGKSLLGRMYKFLTPFYPSLIESYNFSDYEFVISNSYAYVHGLITLPEQLHISFVLTPMRALWIDYEYYISKIPLLNQISKSFLAAQRLWDRVAATRPDYLVAISKEVQARVKNFWGRESVIIYPPVDTKKFNTEVKNESDYFVTVSRLVKHKRIDVIINAIKQTNHKLTVVGNGPEMGYLRRLAGGNKNIDFKGHVSETEKVKILQNAKGFIFASNEDFGISVVEAMAAGLPVLAYKKGGAAETVNESVTGLFFEEQTAESLLAVLEDFYNQINRSKFASEKIKLQADKFAQEKFTESVRSMIEKTYTEFKKNGPPIF
jgi:glycosyltransferase involved in cell wall biosynthesis